MTCVLAGAWSVVLGHRFTSGRSPTSRRCSRSDTGGGTSTSGSTTPCSKSCRPRTRSGPGKISMSRSFCGFVLVIRHSHTQPLPPPPRKGIYRHAPLPRATHSCAPWSITRSMRPQYCTVLWEESGKQLSAVDSEGAPAGSMVSGVPPAVLGDCGSPLPLRGYVPRHGKQHKAMNHQRRTDPPGADDGFDCFRFCWCRSLFVPL